MPPRTTGPRADLSGGAPPRAGQRRREEGGRGAQEEGRPGQAG